MRPPSCTPSRITGLLIGPKTGERLPVLLVRARSAESGALLAETYSADDGQFALSLPLAGAALRGEVLAGALPRLVGALASGLGLSRRQVPYWIGQTFVVARAVKRGSSNA